MKCSICHRETPEEFVEQHHLVPRAKGGKKGETVPVCIDCGDQLHQVFSNTELKKGFNTVEAIVADERIQKWVKWVRKKRSVGVCMKTKKRR